MKPSGRNSTHIMRGCVSGAGEQGVYGDGMWVLWMGGSGLGERGGEDEALLTGRAPSDPATDAAWSSSLRAAQRHKVHLNRPLLLAPPVHHPAPAHSAQQSDDDLRCTSARFPFVCSHSLLNIC